MDFYDDNTEKLTEELNEEFFEENFTEYEDMFTDTDHESENTEKSAVIQKPIMVALIAFVLTAVVVFGTFFVYYLIKGDRSHPIVGVWTAAEAPDCGEYIIFEEDGDVFYTVGSSKRCGTYTVSTIEVEETETQEASTYEVLKSDFFLFNQQGADVKITFSADENNLTVNFLGGELELVRTELPEIKLEPEKITHASADELDITTLMTDKKLFGSWKTEITGVDGTYETYTFNEDGTCLYSTDFIEMYGYAMEIEFKYTVKNGHLLLTQHFFNSKDQDVEFKYRIENDKFIINTNGYEFAYDRVK